MRPKKAQTLLKSSLIPSINTLVSKDATHPRAATPAMLARPLAAVYFGENVRKVRSRSPPELKHVFELDTKVKCETIGSKRTDGWARTVLMIPLWQLANSPTRRPGRKMKAIVKKVFRPLTSSEAKNAFARPTALLTKVNKQAKKMRMKWTSPPMKLVCSLRIRQGPTFRFLATPRIAVRLDVPKVMRNSIALFSLAMST